MSIIRSRKLQIAALVPLAYFAISKAAAQVDRIPCSDVSFANEVDYYDVIFYGSVDPEAIKNGPMIHPGTIVSYNVIEPLKGVPEGTKKIDIVFTGLGAFGKPQLYTARYGGQSYGRPRKGGKLELVKQPTCNMPKDIRKYLKSPAYKYRDIWRIGFVLLVVAIARTLIKNYRRSKVKDSEYYRPPM